MVVLGALKLCEICNGFGSFWACRECSVAPESVALVAKKGYGPLHYESGKPEIVDPVLDPRAGDGNGYLGSGRAGGSSTGRNQDSLRGSLPGRLPGRAGGLSARQRAPV